MDKLKKFLNNLVKSGKLTDDEANKILDIICSSTTNKEDYSKIINNIINNLNNNIKPLCNNLEHKISNIIDKNIVYNSEFDTILKKSSENIQSSLSKILNNNNLYDLKKIDKTLETLNKNIPDNYDININKITNESLKKYNNDLFFNRINGFIKDLYQSNNKDTIFQSSYDYYILNSSNLNITLNKCRIYFEKHDGNTLHFDINTNKKNIINIDFKAESCNFIINESKEDTLTVYIKLPIVQYKSLNINLYNCKFDSYEMDFNSLFIASFDSKICFTNVKSNEIFIKSENSHIIIDSIISPIINIVSNKSTINADFCDIFNIIKKIIITAENSPISINIPYNEASYYIVDTENNEGKINIENIENIFFILNEKHHVIFKYSSNNTNQNQIDLYIKNTAADTNIYII